MPDSACSRLAGAIEARRSAVPGREQFTRQVAISAYQLMACKDDYEVAHLYSSNEFRACGPVKHQAMREYQRKLRQWQRAPAPLTG